MVQNDSYINTHVFVMVNGEGPSVPITTLACIQSLTDLPLELPLPTPLPGVTRHQSLLSHLGDSGEARRLLNTPDSILIPPLIDALGKATIDHIEVKDGYYGGGSLSGKKSQLVQYLLGRNPSLFKGSIHGSQTGDQHASSGQWMRKECTNMAVHHQQTAFNAPAVTPCQTQGNSLNYYPLDHPPISQTTRIVQNKTQNVPPKSFLTYSPYDHPVASSGQQHSVPLHNAISHDTGDSLPSDLQENPQILNSLVKHIVNVPLSSPAVHLFSNGNCADEVDQTSVSAKQNDRTENHILDTSQISNEIPNCSPVINDVNDVSVSLPSSSTPQHVNSSSVIVGSSVPHVNCMKKRAAEQYQSVINNSFEISQSDISAKKNVNSIHNSESTLQLLTVPESESKEETGVNKLEEKDKNENTSKHDVIPKKRRVSATEPVVVLSKLSLKDQLPKKTQKSVRQNTIKSKKTGTPEPAHESTQNKVSKNSDRRRSSACRENATTPQPINSSCVIIPGPSVPHEKHLTEQSESVPNNSSQHSESYTYAKENISDVHNSESTLQTVAVPESEPLKETGVINKFKKNVQKKNTPKSAVISKKKKLSATEPVVVLSQLSLEDQLLAQKSIHQLTIKDRKTESPPESIKVSVQNKVSENSNCRRSSTRKEPHLSNKSPRKQSSNNEHFPLTIKNKETSSPEPEKVSVQNKVSENSIHHHSSTCKEPNLSNKTPRKKGSNNDCFPQTIKDKEPDSSTEPIKVSVDNKVLENSNRHQSSTCKEPDLSNKSSQRKDKKDSAESTKSLKTSVQNKVSENSNRRHSSTSKEPDLSNKPSQRKDKKTDSSPESVKVSAQNKVSENSNRYRSTCKEPNLSNKSPQRKGRKTDSSPESVKVSVQNKVSENSNRRRFSTCKEPDLNNKSPQRKGRKTDSSPETVKISVKNQVSENSNCRRSSTRTEPDLSNKSFQRKDRKTDSSPESVKVSVQNKISKNSNCRRSSTCKEPDLSNKFPQRKGRKMDSSPESVKVSVQNKVSENSNCRRSSTCKEPDLSNKFPQRKGRKMDSSPESVKVSVQNKVSENSNRRHSSALKEPDLSNKSPQRKNRKTDSSPESVEVSVQNKVSENSNHRHSSTSKEPDLSNKSSRRKATKMESSPETVTISVQNKVSENSNRRHSSTSKEPDLSNKSSRRKATKIESSPETVTISVQNKVSENSNHQRSSICKESDLSPRRKDRKTDSSPESVRVSVQSKVLENTNRHRTACKEPDLCNKSPRRKGSNNEYFPQIISDKEIVSSEPVKVSDQIKVSEISNRHHASTDTEPGLRNKSPQGKGSNDCFPSVKITKSVKERELKRSLNSSSEQINKSSTPNIIRKRCRPSALADYIVSSNSEDETSNESYRKESLKKPMVLSTPKKKSPQNKKISTTEPIVVLTKLSLEDQLLAQKSVRQFIIKTKATGKYEPLKLPKKRGHNSEYFPDKKNLVPIKVKGIKRCLNSSLEKINKSSVSKDRARKRHRVSSQSNYIETSNSEDEKSDESYKEESSEEAVLSTSKAKKLKNKKAKKDLASENMSIEDLMDSNTYQHFSRTVDVIFDSMEGIDFSAVNDENEESAAETLIPLAQLQELRSEAAKLKRLHAMSQFPSERLVRLLTILERNIIDGTKLLPVQMLEEQDEDEERLWLELTMERVMRSADASLTALYIMTSPKMPEKVFLEDVIERIVVYLKYQLQNTIFPVFDPAYRLDPKSKTGYAGNIKQKRAHAHKVKEKSFIKLYNKVHEALSLFTELLELQSVTDTIILHVSTLGVSPFFVEGISELQLSALRLVTTVFAHYDKHRSLILEDILSSIARLPTSKRSLRNYRLNSEENIQMLTALVLQLIHSVIRLPESKIDPKSEFSSNEEKPKDFETKEKVYIDKDVLIITSYEASMKTALGFLSVFLKKCGTKNEEMDYRPLFENFVQDLLSTVNKPEWPASELLLSLLGRMLVKNFSNKSMEMTLRVASLDYLGVVAARLRKDAVTSQSRQDMINDIIQRIVTDSDDCDSSPIKSKKKKKKKVVMHDEAQILQKALLQYLDSNAANDPALQFSRRFYIAQWYRDVVNEVRRSDKSLNFLNEESSKKSDPVCNKSKANRSKRGRRHSSQVVHEEEEEEEEEEEKKESKLESDEVDAKVLALAEERKRFLLTVIKQQEPPKINIKEEKHIDYKTAELISQYLASTRHFSKSFDLYLSQILCVLSETAVAVRTKAMKCLTLVVEADPSILARTDMQKGVHGRLLDQSTSVREAAVDLLGKFILIRPELISQYYEMLTARILDTGVSVRKRVIKILKDICLEQPDFPKTPEICVKIIRRVNDEEGIKKLVGDVFQSMWFSPVSDKKQERILQKVKNIAHVVEACRDTGLEWFEQLLTNLLKNKEDGNYKSVLKSCKQIVDCLVEKLLQLEEASENVDSGASSHLVACLTTLHLFSKINPPLVVPHATTIQPYLSMRCNTQSDFLSLKYVAQTLELIVPLIEHPSESFLVQIEEDVVKLILQQHMGLLPSCVSCLGSVVNKVTHNYQFVKDCFQKFFAVLLVCKKGYEKNPENEMLKTMRPKLMRSLYTVGLFCRYFDFDVIDSGLEQNGQISFKNRVFESIIYFNQHDDEDIRLKALTGLGFIMIRHYEFMLGPEVKTLYHDLLTSSITSSLLKCQVLKNITNYLVEEEMQMIQKDSDWKELSKSEDLKEMGDVTSGMASTVIQVYLKQILECVLHTEVSCRKASLSVIQLILGQGLVHPVQIVPYLVCLGSDDDPVIQTKSDQLLQEIEKKYPGFIQMKAMHGVRMSFKMQQLIQNPDEIVRGFRCPEAPVSRNGFLYSLMRSTRQSRRAFLCSLMKLFDEQDRTPLTELLYIADNIAYFSYMTQDEPLFIMHQLDIMLSVSGSNLLQTFRETLSCKQSPETSEQSSTNREVDDDDDDDFETVLKRLPESTSVLQECIIASQGCILLLYVKQTLKEMYGFTDNKIQQYSPNEGAKVYERPLNRKGHVRFNPETVLSFIKMEEFEGELDDQSKEKLVEEYLHFKQLMLTIDPADDDDEKDSQTKPDTSKLTVLPVPNSTEKTVVSENIDETKPVKLPLEKAKIVTSRKCKSPSHSRSHRKPPNTPKEKVKKKHKKKRKRILISASEESDNDPDYMDSS